MTNANIETVTLVLGMVKFYFSKKGEARACIPARRADNSYANYWLPRAQYEELRDATNEDGKKMFTTFSKIEVKGPVVKTGDFTEVRDITEWGTPFGAAPFAKSLPAMPADKEPTNGSSPNFEHPIVTIG